MQRRQHSQRNLALPVTQYPYTGGSITTRQAVELITALVHPSELVKPARNRIRERIRYAREMGELPKSEPFDAPEFFKWALKHKEWQALAQLEGLPRAPNVFKSNITLPLFEMRGHFVNIPVDPERLREAFCRCEDQRVKLEAKVAELKKRNAELQTEVDQLREKERSRIKKARIAGAKGGRGKKL